MAWSLSSLTPPPRPIPPTSPARIHPSSATQGVGLQSQEAFTGCPHCLEHAPACLLLDTLFLQTSAQATFAVGFPWPLDLRLPAPSLLIAPLLSLFSALCFQGTDHFLSFDKFLLVYTFVFFLPPTPSLTEHKLQASQEFFSLFLFRLLPQIWDQEEGLNRSLFNKCMNKTWLFLLSLLYILFPTISITFFFCCCSDL